MAPCCPVEERKYVKTQCPTCGTAGKPVSETTLHHQIRFPDNLSIPACSFHYCSNPACEVGYFGHNGRTFLKTQLREDQHIRAGWLCYCFDISRNDYMAALKTGEADTIKKFVIEQTKADSCACTTRNPSGQCCLADFKRIERESNQ